jgi:Protein-tyrosine phosphatase
MEPVWQPNLPGVVVLPSGRTLRGRALRGARPEGPEPEFGLYMVGSVSEAEVSWPVRWLAWPDFRLPTDPVDAVDAFREAHRRSASERVEVGCHGGLGRTGTALACIAVLDGVNAADAVRYIRERYDARAVETPWQRRYVHRFQA